MSARVLFSNGCSMCYGSEMFDDATSQMCTNNQARLKAAWPGQLGQQLGFDRVVNLGYPGSSNDRILRTTISWLLDEMPGLQESESELLVVIGWSSPMRREFHINGEWRQLIPYHDYNDLPAAILNRTYRELAWSNEESAIRFAIQLLSLQSLLQGFKIKYFFFDAIESLRDINEQAGGLIESYLAHIDTRFYYDPGHVDMAPQTQVAATVEEAGKHPNAAGHADWAGKLAQALKKCGVSVSDAPDEISFEGTGSVKILDRKVGLPKTPPGNSEQVAGHKGTEAIALHRRLWSRIVKARRRDPFIYE